MDYKYSIKEKIGKLSLYKQTVIKNILAVATCKSARTIDRYLSIKCSEHTDIPAKDLDIIAFHLGCNADDLKNYCVIDENKGEQKAIESLLFLKK